MSSNTFAHHLVFGPVASATLFVESLRDRERARERESGVCVCADVDERRQPSHWWQISAKSLKPEVFG